MDRLGTDEDLVWKTLDGTRSDERAMMAKLYREKYGIELIEEFRNEFSNNDVFGPELQKTLALYERGGLTIAERLHYAMKGWGTDDDALRQAISDLRLLSPEDAALIGEQYEELSGKSLRDCLSGDLWGRDWFRANQALEGRPEGILGEAQQLIDFYEWERNGGSNWFNNSTQWIFNDHGNVLDNAVADLRTRMQEHRDNPSQETEAALRTTIDRVSEHLQTFQDARDSASDIVANAVGTAADIAVVDLSGGTATPLVVTIGLAAHGAAAQILPRVIIGGTTCDWEEAPVQGISGAITVGTAPYAIYKAGPGASFLESVLLGAGEGAVNGAVSGFTLGALETALREQTWSNGMEMAIQSIAANGAISAFSGAVTGAGMGAFFRVLERFLPRSRTGVAGGSTSDDPIIGSRSGTISAYEFHPSSARANQALDSLLDQKTPGLRQLGQWDGIMFQPGHATALDNHELLLLSRKWQDEVTQVVLNDGRIYVFRGHRDQTRFGPFSADEILVHTHTHPGDMRLKISDDDIGAAMAAMHDTNGNFKGPVHLQIVGGQSR